MDLIELSAKELEVYELLKEVIDPELLVNIIDLGLVYNIKVNEEAKTIDLTLTLTSSGCPLGDVIIEDARQRINFKFSDFETHPHVVWEPKWTPERISSEGKRILGS